MFSIKMKFTILITLVAIYQIEAERISNANEEENMMPSSRRHTRRNVTKNINKIVKQQPTTEKLPIKEKLTNAVKQTTSTQNALNNAMIEDSPKYLPKLPDNPPEYKPDSPISILKPSGTQNQAIPDQNYGSNTQNSLYLPNNPPPYDPNSPISILKPSGTQNQAIPDQNYGSNTQNSLYLPNNPPPYDPNSPISILKPSGTQNQAIPDQNYGSNLQNSLYLPNNPPPYDPNSPISITKPEIQNQAIPDQMYGPGLLNLPNNPPPYNPNSPKDRWEMMKPSSLQAMKDPMNFHKPLNQSMLQLLAAQNAAAQKAQAQKLAVQQITMQNLNPQTVSHQNFAPMGQSNVPMVKPMTAKEIFGSLSQPMAAQQPTDRFVEYPYYPYYAQGTPDCCQADVIEALCNSKVEPLLSNLIRLSNDQVYYFSPPITAVNPGKNWYQAQDFCRSYGMQLVSVETAAENVLIKNQVAVLLSGLSTGSFWTSLNDFSVEGSYMWAGVGEPASPIPFQSILPSGATADCGEITLFSNGWDQVPFDPLPAVRQSIIPPFIGTQVVWNDQNCLRKSRFICEMICPCNDLINII